MRITIDQMNRSVAVALLPQRIISLVPSQTELLFELGLGDRVIGITKFCIYPEQWFRTKTRIGGTKDFNPALIRPLKPDLIIANKEENDQLLLAPLMEEFPVWVSDISNLGDAISMINSIGTITGTTDKATIFTEQILHEFDDLATYVKSIPAQKVAYLIWKDPWMSVGNDTFINDMLRRCGWHSVLENHVRYPIVTIEQLQDLRPDLLLLSSEPYPFKEEQLVQLQKLFPASIVHLVDGECFSWYGSRLKGSPSYFRRLLQELRKGDCD